MERCGAALWARVPAGGCIPGRSARLRTHRRHPGGADQRARLLLAAVRGSVRRRLRGRSRTPVGTAELAADGSDGGLRCLGHRLFRGVVSLEPPGGALRVGRVGLLGAEGESDLLLRRARRGLLQAAPGPDVPAARSGVRGRRVPLHGVRRPGHAPPPVLVLLPRFCGCRYRTALHARPAAAALALRAAHAVQSKPVRR